MSTQIDYTFFYKEKFNSSEELRDKLEYDLFISAFKNSERVTEVFNSVDAKNKHWLILDEYDFTPVEIPTEEEKIEVAKLEERDEGECIRKYFEEFDPLSHKSICIDITGFIGAYLIFLVRFLKSQDVDKIDFLYSEPIRYRDKEETVFTEDYTEVRPVLGCEGSHNPETDNDFLIIATGYDNKRIANVAINKADAKKVKLFGLPSLQPDMFQENVMKAYQVEEATSGEGGSFIDSNRTLFSPANDPFVTAQEIKEFVNEENKIRDITNLYLSPLSTKAHTLGIALYFIFECLNEPVSIVLPFCDKYKPESAVGISKIWKYTVEFTT